MLFDVSVVCADRRRLDWTAWRRASEREGTGAVGRDVEARTAFESLVPAWPGDSFNVRPPFVRADHSPFEYLQLAASVDRTAEASHQVTSRALMYRYWSCALGGSRSSDWWCWKRAQPPVVERDLPGTQSTHIALFHLHSISSFPDIVIGSRDNARIL